MIAKLTYTEKMLGVIEKLKEENKSLKEGHEDLLLLEELREAAFQKYKLELGAAFEQYKITAGNIIVENESLRAHLEASRIAVDVLGDRLKETEEKLKEEVDHVEYLKKFQVEERSKND